MNVTLLDCWCTLVQLEHMQAKHNTLLSNINISIGWRDINMSYDLTNVLIRIIFSPFVSSKYIPRDKSTSWSKILPTTETIDTSPSALHKWILSESPKLRNYHSRVLENKFVFKSSAELKTRFASRKKSKLPAISI